MVKLSFLIIFAIAISGCNTQREELIINLHPEKGYGVFTPIDEIIFPNNDSIGYKGVPFDLKEFVVRSMPLQSHQYLWDRYKKGKIDKDRFLSYSSDDEIDTTKLTSNTVDYQAIILIGTNQKDKRVIIIDSNNDEDFSDEKVLEYDFPLSLEEQKEIKDSLPVIATKFEFFIDDKIITRTIDLKPNPYKGRIIWSYDNMDEAEHKYYLSISIPEYKKGVIEINEMGYNVFVSNGFTSPSFTNSKTEIFISNSQNKKPSQTDGEMPFKVNEIFNSNGHDYLINSISTWGDTVKLNYIGLNAYPVGITDGFYFPKFKAKKLNNSVFSLEEYKDKYVLMDFWGTWCNPCIASIPKLKELNTEFKDKNFVLVSVAYDRDAQKVLEFVTKEKMDWEHVFVDQKEKDKNSLIEKLRITMYPSTILIAPNGEIIARNKEIDELKKILSEKTNAL